MPVARYTPLATLPRAAGRRAPRLLGLCVAILAGLSVLPAEARWYTYPDCQLIANEFNDGDSFHIKRGRKHDLVRLYFVDTPETDRTLEERVDEQAAYWGLAPESMQKLGKEAQRFTAEFLKNGFRVQTQFEDARGNSKRKRSYAFVQAGERDLAEALVEAGLARIYGRMVDHPEGRSKERYLARLRAAERHAKADRRGAWGLPKAEAPARMFVPPSTATVTNIPQRTLALTQPLAVYSLRTSELVGVLKTNTTVRVLQVESPGMVRIRFTSDGKTYEGKCRRSELGM